MSNFGYTRGMQTDDAKTYSKISKLIGVASLVVLVGLTLAVFLYQRESIDGGDFELQYRNQPWRFSEHANDINILYIGYAKCPDVCPMTLSHVAQALKQLGPADQQKVSFFFLSVDRDHDNQDDVATYASQFNPSFIGLSGTREQIDNVSRLYHATYIIDPDPNSRLGYSISHADRIHFLDRKGKVITKIQSPHSSDEIASALKGLL